MYNRKCYSNSAKINNVERANRRYAVKEMSKKLQDKGFFRRLNEMTKAEDAVANDVVYQNCCWENAILVSHIKKKMRASTILYHKLKL